MSERLREIELALHNLRREKLKLRSQIRRVIAEYPQYTNLVIPIEMPKWEPYIPSWHTPQHKEIRFKPSNLPRNEALIADKIEIFRMLNDYRFIPANGVHVSAS